MHEASLYEENCFVTLTYNDEHLPDNEDLNYEDFQKFMKRLRKKFTGRKIRFFMCAEYGDDLGRPHYHACLFNIDFNDRVYFKTSKAGSKIFTSKTLDNLWRDRKGDSMGFATVGNVSIDSAGYVARYVMKKKFGHGSDEAYQRLDLETGDLVTRCKEFNRMSLKDGIGTGFYNKYAQDLFLNDCCVVNGKATKPPQFYFKKLKKDFPHYAEELSLCREDKGRKRSADNTEERLEAKERCLVAKLKLLKRELS